MRAKYLGRFYVDVHPIEGSLWLLNEETDEVEAPLELFMITDSDSLFDGVATECNTSALAIKDLDGSGDAFKMWRLS